MPKIKFTKMHGLGNDFIVIDAISQSFMIENFPIKKLSNRYTGIGFDQLLLIGASHIADFSCRIFNSDGSEAEQCGNGMRCIGRFIKEKNLSEQSKFSIETLAGIIEVTVNDFDHIIINMGIPLLEADQEISLDATPEIFKLSILSLGNPHAILKVNSIENFPLKEIAEKISNHAIFPNGCNVGIIEIMNSNQIQLRTYERGAGETLACGSNACAAAIAAIKNYGLQQKVRVKLALGELGVEWAGPGTAVIMTGPAETVFEGFLIF